MKYLRTVAGGMMAIKPKINTLIAETKKTAIVKHQDNKLKNLHLIKN